MTMHTKWHSVKLGKLAKFRNGINYNKNNFGKGLKVINVKDFQDYSFVTFDGLEEINPDGLIREDNFLKKNDIIFVRSNGNRQLIGRSLFVRSCPERISHSAFSIKLRFDSEEVYPLFYAYLFRTSLIRETLSSQGNGTNISNLNQEILSNLEVPLPPLSTQRKIAGILSAYDDLIENNTRRIEILEEMARMLYREWFVKFRFPVDDGGEGGGDRPSSNHPVELVESELGLIPKGWEVKKLGEVIELAYGKSLTAKNRLPGDVPVFSSAGLIDYHNQSMVKAPGIVVGRKGNVGSVFWANKDFFPIDTTFYVQTDLPLHYVFYNLQNQNFVNNDAAVPGLNRNQAYSLDILIPESKLLQEFSKVINDFFQEIENLNQKNINLRKTRDLLLPRLISGEIDVEELDLSTGTKIEEPGQGQKSA